MQSALTAQHTINFSVKMLCLLFVHVYYRCYIILFCLGERTVSVLENMPHLHTKTETARG